MADSKDSENQNIRNQNILALIKHYLSKPAIVAVEQTVSPGQQGQQGQQVQSLPNNQIVTNDTRTTPNVTNDIEYLYEQYSQIIRKALDANDRGKSALNTKVIQPSSSSSSSSSLQQRQQQERLQQQQPQQQQQIRRDSDSDSGSATSNVNRSSATSNVNRSSAIGSVIDSGSSATSNVNRSSAIDSVIDSNSSGNAIVIGSDSNSSGSGSDNSNSNSSGSGSGNNGNNGSSGNNRGNNNNNNNGSSGNNRGNNNNNNNNNNAIISKPNIKSGETTIETTTIVDGKVKQDLTFTETITFNPFDSKKSQSQASGQQGQSSQSPSSQSSQSPSSQSSQSPSSQSSQSPSGQSSQSPSGQSSKANNINETNSALLLESAAELMKNILKNDKALTPEANTENESDKDVIMIYVFVFKKNGDKYKVIVPNSNISPIIIYRKNEPGENNSTIQYVCDVLDTCVREGIEKETGINLNKIDRIQNVIVNKGVTIVQDFKKRIAYFYSIVDDKTTIQNNTENQDNTKKKSKDTYEWIDANDLFKYKMRTGTVNDESTIQEFTNLKKFFQTTLITTF